MQTINFDIMSIIDSRPLNRAERRKQETHLKLLQATAHVLTQGGYKNFSIKAVTDHADVGYGTFYNHFDNSDMAIWSVLLKQFEQSQSEIESNASHLASPQRELTSWQLFFENIKQNSEQFMQLFGEDGSARLRYELEAYTATVYMRNIIAKRFTIPLAYRDLPADYLAHFMSGAQLQLVRWWLKSNLTYTASDLAKMLYQTIYHSQT